MGPDTRAALFFLLFVMIVAFVVRLLTLPRKARRDAEPQSRASPALFCPPVSRLKDFLCPPVSRLKDLLAERLPQEEQARLNRHLERCPACQHRLEGLVAAREPWSGLAKHLSQPPQREAALKQVMENLKREPDPEPTRDEPAVPADLPLGFLSPSDKPDQLGRLGPYEVLAEIGRGGMGIVLKAFDPTLHRVVAIKVLAPQLATSGVARKRFMREAQAVAAVTHDHIVTIHAVEEANGLPYLVMQYVPGQSLQDRIDKEGPLPLKEVLRIGMQTAAGLAAAHAQGIIHRDIKPANILLENGVQRVKLTDFGLARAMDDASVTQSGFVAGSPQYMAPEQARGETLDHRADLFSLGSVLYTMCTGRPPFRAANTFAVLRRVSEETPRPIREVNPEIPDWLAAVVDKLHAKDPAARYQSAGDVAEVLGRHLAELQQASYVPPPLPAPPPAGAAAEPNGLLTSLTICPSCGAELHVPERMVGGTVHCPECGQPFRVEQGSEEIQVARALKPAPLAPSRPGNRFPRRSRFPIVAAVFLGLMFLTCLGVFSLYFAPSSSRQPAHGSLVPHAQAWPDGPGVPKAPTQVEPWPQFWTNTLNGFPEGAALFGAVDLRRAQLGNATPPVLDVVMPPGARQVLAPEELWRLGGLDGFSFAYYFDQENPDKSRQLLRLRYGSALGTRQKLLTSLRRTAPDVDAEVGAGGAAPAASPVRMASPQLPFALGLLDDSELFLAGYREGRAGGAKHLDVLERVAPFDFSGNRRPPKSGRAPRAKPAWPAAALKDIPRDVSGVVVGEITPDLGKFLSERLGLQVCPRTFVLYAKAGPKGLELHTVLKVATAGSEQILLRNLRFLGDAGFTALFPPEMKNRSGGAVLQRWLNALSGTTLRWETGKGLVRGQMSIPYQNLSDLGAALAALADPPAVHEARTAAEGILNDLLAGKLDDDPQLGRLPDKVKGFRSWSIESQEVKPDNPRAVTFRGTLTGSPGEAGFTMLLVKQADGRWMIASFGGPNPK
jgi:serine/threonine-protein kinase